MLYVYPSPDGQKALYPNTNLTSGSQKEVLRNTLANPLVEKNCTAVSFRIIWRSNDQERDHVWKNILNKRDMCDTILKKVGGVAFFISSITGLYNKPKNPQSPKIVYPAVSYWIAMESSEIKGREIMLMLQSSLQLDGAENVDLRTLQEPPLVTVETMCAALYCAVKDHGSGYVKRRIAESYDYLHSIMDLIETPSQPSRLVLVRPSVFTDVAVQAHPTLSNGHVAFDLVQVYPQTMSILNP